MTRKEVCKATGLSVKTLRLYEEKGLITLNTQRRNGREYREYTPETVRQLEQIATLRRALFTMEEIKLMQTQPDRIPAIFQDYQQWLAQQEQQFHRLRQAADRIPGDQLSSLDGLLSGLSGAADSMPLPPTDIHPNFRRLDEIEETRLVQRQVNLDDMVPDARVFRQMNLVMDGDKANNINIAFGQYNELRRDTPPESGPVQRKAPAPRWCQILGGVLTGLLILSILLIVLSGFFPNRYVSIVFRCGIVLLAARLALLGVPMCLEHRRWLKAAQQSDAARQGGSGLSGYARERRRRRKWMLLGVLGVLILAGLIALLCRVLYAEAHPDTDLRVCFVAPAHISDRDLQHMEAALAPLAGDLDGNGEAVAAVDLLEVREGLWVRTDLGDVPMQDYLQPNAFQQSVKPGTYLLYFLADLDVGQFNLCREFDFYRCCKKLPEDLADPDDPYRVTFQGSAPFQAADLEQLSVCGCIPNSVSPEEYELAVEMLRKILDS